MLPHPFIELSINPLAPPVPAALVAQELAFVDLEWMSCAVEKGFFCFKVLEARGMNVTHTSHGVLFNKA